MQEFRHCGAETTKLAHREALSFGNQGSVSPEWDQRVWCRAAAERAQWGQVEFALIRRVSVPGGGEAGGRGVFAISAQPVRWVSQASFVSLGRVWSQ